MNKEECIAFMKKFPNFQLATVDSDGQPRTRGMFLYTADEDGLVFPYGFVQKLYTELTANPRIEASFFDRETMTQLRAAGIVEEIDDADYGIRWSTHGPRF